MTEGDRIPLVPDHQVKARTAVLSSGIPAGADLRYTGEQWPRGDEANETSPLSGYFVANLRAGFSRGRWGSRAS